MASWHGYLLLTQPSEINDTDWGTIKTYLATDGILNETPSADQPSERWHIARSGNDIIAESVFETTELTLASLGQHYSDALGGTPNAATMQTYLDDGAGDLNWQAFAIGEYIEATAATTRHHLNVYGYVCRGPRTTALDAYYISLTGSALNDGSLGSPWTLAHVADGSAGVQQGDTIWMRGGNYGQLPKMLIAGYSDPSYDQPIVFRGYYADWVAGNYPIIEGGERLESPDIRFWNVVFAGDNAERFANEGGSGPSDLDTTAGIEIQAPNISIINCLIHDANGVGIGNWQAGPNQTSYGVVTWNNGWDSDDSRSNPLYDVSGNRTSERFAHGHGQYVQNASGTKDSKHCVFLPSFGFTYSAHSASGTGQLVGVEFRSCLFYGYRSEIGWTGSVAVVKSGLVDGCVLYETNYSVGQKGSGGSADITNSFLRNTTESTIKMRGLTTGSFTGNTVVATYPASMYTYQLPGTVGDFSFDNNTYRTIQSTSDNVVGTGGDGSGNPAYTAGEWQATGRDPNSTFTHLYTPSGKTFWVWANDYKDANDPRVGIFVIVDEDGDASVTTDLSALGMVNLSNYKFFNAFDYFGDTPTSYVSDGVDTSVSITMTGWSMAVPSGTHQGNTMLEPLDPLPSNMRVFIVEEA